MATYDISILHGRMLKILQIIDATCKEHSLNYGMFAGSLIGAIRHKGFIPWDDDMDILMPRPDYEIFINNCKDWLPKPYEFVCSENDTNYPLPFGKVQDSSTTLIERFHLSYLGGIYVDVFPLDGVPNNYFKRHIHFARYEFYKQALYLVHRDPFRHGHGLNSLVPLLVRRIYTMKGIQDKIRKLLLSCRYEGSELVADYTDGLRGVMSKDVEGVYSTYLFEGETFMGIKRYDDYLSQIYGDYMKLPDVEHQKQHNFDYLDFCKPYKEYNQDKS